VSEVPLYPPSARAEACRGQGRRDRFHTDVLYTSTTPHEAGIGMAVKGPSRPPTALEATQGQTGGFFSPLPYKYHQNRVASQGD